MPSPLTQELGVAGVSGRYGSYGAFGDPFELRELSGRQGLFTYRRMRDDPTCGAVITAAELLCRAAPWHFEPKDTGIEAKELADFCQSIIDDMDHSWQDAISDALTMAPYGWAALEHVWKRRGGPDQKDPSKRSAYSDGLLGLRRLVGRDQLTLDRWVYDEGGALAAFVQRPPEGGGEIPIPMDRILLFRTSREHGSPYGRSLLRSAYEPWRRRLFIEDIERLGIERELAGLPVMRAPEEVVLGNDPESAAKRRACEDIISKTRMGKQDGLLLSSQQYRNNDGSPNGVYLYGMDLLTAAGSRTIDTGPVIARYDGQIARSALADFLMLGANREGSFALSKSKTDLFLSALEWLLDVIADTVQRHLLPKVMALNGLDQRITPVIHHGPAAPPDLKELGDFLESLERAGAPLFPDRALENSLRTMAGLPEAVEEEPERGLGDNGGPPLDDEEAMASFEERVAALERAQGAAQ